MEYWKIEFHEPIGGYHYLNEVFASKESAKRRLRLLIGDVVESGIKGGESEGEGWYEFYFSLGMSSFYTYKVLRSYAG